LALALLAITLAAGIKGGLAPSAAEANVNCGEQHRLRIDIVDDDTDNLLAITGTEIEISPDPRDGAGVRTYVDNGEFDDNATAGRMDENEACEVNDTATPGPAAYTITIEELPAGCEAVSAETGTTTLTSNSIVTFHVEDCDDPDDVTISITPTQSSVSCGSTTGLTLKVTRDGSNVPNDTDIDLSASRGSVSPSRVDTENGGAFATYQAPNSGSGAATITASALGQTKTVSIDISCGGGAGSNVPAQLNFPSTVCAGNNRANVGFSWTPTSNASAQYLDITLFDNNFAPGTFIGAALGSSSSQLTWNGLIQDLPHYWRITTLTNDGWLVSSTGAFVPCGGPELRGTSYTCTGSNRAAVTFFWAPASPGGSSTWLDLTLFNNGFAPGSFIGAGPLGNVQQITWPGILADATHYYRINSFLSGTGWVPSSTGSFFANC
jgi:uncharacterized protein (DUF736 family)